MGGMQRSECMGEEDLEDGSQSEGEDGRGGETVPRWGRPGTV
jgi:hypothetical protein